MSEFDIPTDITQWLSDVFVKCNELVTEKLCNNPNIQEEWLDYSWIEQLSRFSTPVTLGSGWIARVQAHYLGGMRHWGMWEIADRRAVVCPEPHAALAEEGRIAPVQASLPDEYGRERRRND